jgi:hypothetical protein
MGVIIGAVTTVSFGGHATQVSWSISSNIQRAYVLGSWDPYGAGEIKSPTETLNITTYSPGPSYSTTPTTSCVNANQLSASVSPTGCGAGSAGPTSHTWYVTSYNYSKGDARSPGTESWSLMNYVTLGDAGVVLPTYVLRGISEGSITSSDGVSTAEGVVGVHLTGDVDEGTTGNVSAGQIGSSNYLYTGVVSSVGASTGGSGDIGEGQCSMPYNPLYL